MGLTLQQALTIVESALKKGRETGCAPVAVAVLDDGGHLKPFAREDGAGILRPQIATGTAWDGPCPSMADYVTLTGPKDGATAAGGRSCCCHGRPRGKTLGRHGP